MEDKEIDKIRQLKEKADRKREIGERNETVNEVNRAFVEDEMIRKNAQRNAENYLKDLNETDGFPSWMWFCTGVLFVIIIEVFVLNTTVADFLVRFFYGS